MRLCDAGSGTYRIVQGVGSSEKGENWGWEVGTHMPGTRSGGLVGITLGWSRDDGEKERRGGDVEWVEWVEWVRLLDNMHIRYVRYMVTSVGPGSVGHV